MKLNLLHCMETSYMQPAKQIKSTKPPPVQTRPHNAIYMKAIPKPGAERIPNPPGNCIQIPASSINAILGSGPKVSVPEVSTLTVGERFIFFSSESDIFYSLPSPPRDRLRPHRRPESWACAVTSGQG